MEIQSCVGKGTAYGVPEREQDIKLNEMEVVGNVYDNPELLEECNE